MFNVKILDSIAIPADLRRAAELAAQEREQKYLAAPISDTLTPILNQAKIEFNLRILRQVQGGKFLVPDENCTFDQEKLDSIPEELKSSSYWITYTNHRGEEITSQKRIYNRNFQVQENPEKPETKIGKCDFDHQIVIEEVPSIELRDWILNDVIINLWESRPIINKVRDEELDKELDRVQIDPETELPKVETLDRGVSNIHF
jgi:hypothetical protein